MPHWVTGLVLFVFLIAASLGHVGLWVFAYNRINSTGLRRKTIKRIEMLFVLAAAVIPVLLFLLEWSSGNLASIAQWQLDDTAPALPITAITSTYLVVVTLFAFVVGPFWISDRPQFVIASHRFRLLESNVHRNLQHANPQWLVGKKFKTMARLPRNEIVSVELNRKSLVIDGLPSPLVGLTVAHLSDVHLTGQMTSDFYRKAVQWLSDCEPDLFIISGDIVDYAHALDLLTPVFENVNANYGKFFVLGNHDKRLVDPLQVSSILTGLGWHDLGKTPATVTIHNTQVHLSGNERPWFHRVDDLKQQALEGAHEQSFFLGVAHSPDQFPWAIKHDCTLLLSGHTHGGQIRFPVIGPVIAPSWYGSRYASGVFYSKPTVMHVSRGLSGVHPYRWNCMPEATLLELSNS